MTDRKKSSARPNDNDPLSLFCPLYFFSLDISSAVGNRTFIFVNFSTSRCVLSNVATAVHRSSKDVKARN